MDGLIVTGGIARTVRTIHSGLTCGTFNPNISQSESGIFSSLALISIGLILLSSSMKVVGFSSVIFFCFALQLGHLLTVFRLAIMSFIFCLLSSTPASFSIWSSCSFIFGILLSGISILPHSLQVHLTIVITMFTNLTCMIGLASSMYPKCPMHSFNFEPHVLHRN